MRRLPAVVVAILLTVTVLHVVPETDAQLPQTKQPTWQQSVDGNVQQVAVCEGEACASDWVSASTGNTLGGGDQANLYSFEPDGDIAWAWNVEGGADEAGFAMTGTDVTDDGERVVGVSDQMANQGLTSDDEGPFWLRESTAGGEILARADSDDIDNAQSSDDQKLTTWLPGRDVFAMIKDPAATDQEGRVWVYTGGLNSAPYRDWNASGALVAAGSAVDVVTTQELVVAGFNDGGSANVALFEDDDPTVDTRIDASNGAVDEQLNAIGASRDGNIVVLGTEADKAYVFRARVEGNSVNATRIAPVFTDGPVDTVAVSADGRRFALGGSFGISSYRLTGGDDPITRTWEWRQSVSELDMSHDGRYVAAISPSDVRFFWNRPPEEQSPAVLWTSTNFDGSPVSVDTGYAGSGTAVGDDAGNVYFFDLDYSLQTTIDPSSRRLDPGVPNNFTLTLENTGDALADLTLSATGPEADWVEFATDDATDAPLSGVTVLPTRTETVTVQVTPPAGTSAQTSFSATIDVTIDSSPDDTTETESISGTVRESYGVVLDPEPSSINLLQGQQQIVDLTVTNAGNLQDTIVLEVGQPSEGWTATVARSSFQLAGGGSDSTNLTIRAPDQADQGVTENIQVFGTSQGDTTEQGRTTVLATVGPSSGVDLSAPGNADARAGEATPIDVTVTNVGNQRSTFDLSLQAPGSWATALSTETATLDARAGQDVTVTVTPPSDASGSATITVSAVAQDDTSISAEQRIVVRVTHGFLGLPGLGPVAVVAAFAAGLWAVSRRRR